MNQQNNSNPIIYRPIEVHDFQQVDSLGTLVHGDGYLDENSLERWVNKGIKDDINASFVAFENNELVGFRLTFSINQWHVNNWCSPNLWKAEQNKVCYFKCNTVAKSHRGLGIGGKLLKLSIAAAKLQGAHAGVSHLWKQSPNNSAVMYFSKCGGEHIKSHPDRWLEDSKNGYNCTICGFDCHCEAAEMIIYFE
jgi:GNAT superfamily N-acetyltransferase